MYWRDANDPTTEHVVSVVPQDGTDSLLRYTVNRVREQENPDDAHRQSLIIHCDTQWQLLQECQSSVFSQGREELEAIEPDTLRANYRSALNQGLAMDEALWEQLQTLALRVLVESSEQSRMGAGA